MSRRLDPAVTFRRAKCKARGPYRKHKSAVVLDPELRAAAVAQCQRERRSLASLIREALREYLHA